MRESFEKKYEDATISVEELKRYKKQMLLKHIFFWVLYFGMIIGSFIGIKRTSLFIVALGGGKIISFYTLAIFIFYLSLYAVFLFQSVVLGYIVISKYKDKEWLDTIHKVNIKSDLAVFIGKCLSILLFIMIYITTPCTVVGQSMEPTFQSGDRLMTVHIFYEPKREDVVVIDARNYTNQQSFYLKRIVAVSGDVLTYDNGTKINGVDCQDIRSTDFNVIRDSYYQDPTLNEFVVPEGYVIVLGDNRGNSLDSRKFGMVKKEDIFGKVYLRVLPIGNMKLY